jgi:hypothetical protein
VAQSLGMMDFGPRRHNRLTQPGAAALEFTARFFQWISWSMNFRNVHVFTPYIWEEKECWNRSDVVLAWPLGL